MLELIIKDINAKVDELRIFDKIHSLCHQVQRNTIDTETGEVTDTMATFPACYLQDGEFSHVDFDNLKSVFYSRRDGNVTIVENEEYELGCEIGLVHTFPLRMVGLIFQCFDDDNFRDEKMVENVIHAIHQFDNRLICQKMSFDSIRVKINGYSTDRYNVIADEFQNINIKVPFESVIFSIDAEIIIETDNNCWVNFKTMC